MVVVAVQIARVVWLSYDSLLDTERTNDVVNSAMGSDCVVGLSVCNVVGIKVFTKVCNSVGVIVYVYVGVGVDNSVGIWVNINVGSDVNDIVGAKVYGIVGLDVIIGIGANVGLFVSNGIGAGVVVGLGVKILLTDPLLVENVVEWYEYEKSGAENLYETISEDNLFVWWLEKDGVDLLYDALTLTLLLLLLIEPFPEKNFTELYENVGI